MLACRRWHRQDRQTGSVLQTVGLLVGIMLPAVELAHNNPAPSFSCPTCSCILHSVQHVLPHLSFTVYFSIQTVSFMATRSQVGALFVSTQAPWWMDETCKSVHTYMMSLLSMCGLLRINSVGWNCLDRRNSKNISISRVGIPIITCTFSYWEQKFPKQI